MKYTCTCSKCGSGDVLRVDGTSGAYGTGNNIQTGITFWSAVKVNRYICCQCGFVEEWIDQKDIERLKKSFR